MCDSLADPPWSSMLHLLPSSLLPNGKKGTLPKISSSLEEKLLRRVQVAREAMIDAIASGQLVEGCMSASRDGLVEVDAGARLDLVHSQPHMEATGRPVGLP